VGIENVVSEDERIILGYAYRVQFCQWAIAAVPGHPLLRRAVDIVAENAQTMTGMSYADTIARTGPGAWTRAVREHIAATRATASGIDSSDVDLDEILPDQDPQFPALIPGTDVLLLPRRYFGKGHHWERDRVLTHWGLGSWKR
jgi:hypothetical protein